MPLAVQSTPLPGWETVMAMLMPARHSCLARMSAGEKRFSERLESALGDRYVCAYDLPIGERGQRPDFLVLDPQRGALLIEVRDWTLNSIQEISSSVVSRLTANGLRDERNPMLQVRAMALELVLQLDRDPLLKTQGSNGVSGRKRLAVSIGWGLVLPNISRWDFETCALAEVLDSRRVICRDELAEPGAAAFENLLWGLLGDQPAAPLSAEQFHRLRWQLFLELRLCCTGGRLGAPQAAEVGSSAVRLAPQRFAALDRDQEQLLRRMDLGSRVVIGGVGSGKTSLLLREACLLASGNAQPVLLICVDRLLAVRLRMLTAVSVGGSRVHVFAFEDWCRELLANCGASDVLSLSTQDQVSIMRQRIESGVLVSGCYSAVFVDEAQCLDAPAIEVLADMVEPASGALCCSCGPIRSPSGEGCDPVAVLKLPASQVYRLQAGYRLSSTIVQLAIRFASEEAMAWDGALASPAADATEALACELLMSVSFEDEAEQIARSITALLAQPVAADASEYPVAILWRRRGWVGTLERALMRHDIGFHTEEITRQDLLFESRASVLLIDLDHCHGLEFDHVYIPGIGDMPDQGQPLVAEELRLLRGMTRARRGLHFTYQHHSPFVQRINAALHAGQGQQATG